MRRAALVLVAAACSQAVSAVPSTPAPSPPAPVDGGLPVPVDAAATPRKVDAGVLPVPAAPPQAISVEGARALLFLPGGPEPPLCSDGTRDERIHCLISARYAGDVSAKGLAIQLFEATGDLAGLLPPGPMDGGYRGTIELVPELPVGARRAHLDWVLRGVTDHDRFFEELTQGHPDRVRYRWRALGFRFTRSVKARTPSAFAEDWSIAYNVDGSLNTSADGVRELLFHEIFHLNDAAHGDWAKTALGPIFDAIDARCHTNVACLAPYAPTTMKVRGGTYYAFQPNNGAAVREYAAELALRYYQEERALLRHEAARRPFKCGPKENQAAWKLIVDEFWGGIDGTVCP